MTFLAKRLQNMGESATLKMAQLARDLAAKGHQVINLSLGEPDFDTPQSIKEAAKQALDQGFTKYTPVAGTLELRQAICHKLQRDNGLSYQPNQIVVSNGAKQSFANLSMSLLDEGDEVIVFSPYWVSYKEIIGLSGAKPVFIYAGVEQDYKVSPAQLAAAINERTRMIVFSSPCNPTGSVFSKAELQALAQVIHQAQNQEIVIVSDEIYEYINFTKEGHFSIAACPEIAARTVVINGFSKGYSMTGWRLGYIAAPLWIAEACVKMQGQFTSGASSFGQKAATFALQTELPEVKTMNEAFRQRRDLMLDLFAAIPGFSFNRPEGAFYLFPDISALIGKSFEGQVMKSAEDLAYFFLYQAHVALVSGEAFGAPNCIRFSYAASEDHLRMAAARIAKAVALLA